MNILTDKLPVCVRVGSSVFSINTDFRAGIAFELMVDAEETNVEAVLSLFFPDGIPKDIDGALTAVLWFYACGNAPKEDGEKTKSKPAYSFAVDAETIFADFWQYYGIDLSQASLHWWAFRALLVGLPEESGYKKRIYYRTCDLKDLPKKEKARIGRIRKQIAIEQKQGAKMTLAERNAQMMEYVNRRSNDTKKGG